MADVDTVLRLLDSERRRHALYYLDEQETPVSIETLAEEVSNMEADADSKSISEYEVQLKHTDLPKAAEEADFIEFDASEGVVRLTAEPPTYESILTVAKVLEQPM